MGIQWNHWINFEAGLRLCPYDYALDNNEVLSQKRDTQPGFEIDFTLCGKVQVQVIQFQGKTNDFFIQAGTNGLYYLPGMAELETRLDIAEGMAPKGVLISGDAAKLNAFATRHKTGTPLPWEESDVKTKAFACEHNATTPAMKMVIEQILYPPVEPGFQSIYLKGKVLELIALQLSQRAKVNANSSSPRLTKQDREKLFHARQILLSRLENPPSISELSRLAGINDFKLKAGFRQIFGDSVFHTLKNARMDKARRLFDETGENVLHIANQVGYANPSHFAAAFRQRFGMSPRAYLNHRQVVGE
nr:AraC family transcriptional regulator [uncultured Desulfobacter sp.]